MTGSFGSINIAKSGLQAQQVAIDVAGNNISNVSTDGYVRRRANETEVGGTDQPTMWAFYTGHGEGVTTSSVQRLTNELLEERVRQQTGTQQYLQAQADSLGRVETALGEPGDDGISSALNSFIQSWQELVSNPGGTSSDASAAARQQVISSAQVLTASLNSQAGNIASEQQTMFTQAVNDVQQVNTDATQIAQLNHQIYVASAASTDVNDLLDQRDRVAADLASLTGASVTQQADGRFNVTVNGVALVTGDSAGTMRINDGAFADQTLHTGWSGSQPVYEIDDPVTGARPSTAYNPASTTNDPKYLTSLGGDLGGINVLLGPSTGGNRSLTDFMAGLDSVAQLVGNTVNDIFSSGYDINGTLGSANASQGYFFVGANGVPGTTDAYGNSTADATNNYSTLGSANATKVYTALSIHVNSSVAGNPNLLTPAASDLTPPLPTTLPTTQAATFNTDNADAMYQALIGADGTHTSVTGHLQSVVTNIGATISAVNTQATNQQALTQQVSNELQQESGVSLDEETVNLMQAERSYQASSRVLTTMDSVLNTLINVMGG